MTCGGLDSFKDSLSASSRGVMIASGWQNGDGGKESAGRIDTLAF
jgi:glycerate kinase